MTEIFNNIIEPQEFGEIDESLFERQIIEKINYKHIFGPKLADHIARVAKGSSCCTEYILMNLLILSSAIIGNKRKIYVWPGWTEPSHLWGALVGSPSCRKSASMTPFYRALEPLKDRRQKEYEEIKAAYLDRIKAIKRDAENKEIAKEKIEALHKPILRQIIVNDATVEAVCKVIDERKPERVCLWRDEFAGFIKSLEKYNKSDKTLFLEGYNGNPYTINRVKNDEPIQISKLSLSLLGGIQPDKLRPILKEGDDGFVSRFLFAYSEPQLLEMPEPDFRMDHELFKVIFDKLDGLEESTIKLSSEALETLKEWLKENEAEKRYASGLLESSYGKFHGQLIRIACTLENLLWAAKEDESPAPTEISNIVLESAIDLMDDYFKPMAKKIFCECGNSKKDAPSIRKLIKYFIDNKLEVFNWREVVTRGVFRELGQEKDRIIETLTECGVIKEIPTSYSSQGGRPKSEYKINPKIRELRI